MAIKITEIKGIVREVGNISHGLFVPRGVRLEVKDEPANTPWIFSVVNLPRIQ